MNPRLVLCLLASALAGTATAAVTIVSGHGVLVAMLACWGTSSASLLVLAFAAAPRAGRARRPALLPAPGRRTVA